MAMMRLIRIADLSSIQAAIFQNLKAAFAIAAYRLAQEALSNIVKHAAASKVSVSLFVDDEENALHITVSDNGAGFDQRRSTPGLGLSACVNEFSRLTVRWKL